jgi:hypothetical protein
MGDQAIFPLVSHEPDTLRTVGAVSGSVPAVPYSTTVAATHVTEPRGFSGAPVIVSVINLGAGALIAGDDIQVQLSGDDFATVETPADFLFDLTGVGIGGRRSFEVNGPVGQKFQVRNTSAQSLRIELFVQPNR